MDIRNFFGKTSQSKKKKKAPPGSSSNDRASDPSQQEASAKSNKAEVDLDDSSTEDEKVVVARVQNKSKTRMKRSIVLDDDDSSTGYEPEVCAPKKRKNLPKEPMSTPSKKSKSGREEKQNRTEISASDFFARSAEKNPRPNADHNVVSESAEAKEDEKDVSPIHLSPPREDSTKKRDRTSLELDNEAETEEPQEISASPVTPPSTKSTPAKKMRKSPTPSKSPKRKKKDPLLEPIEPLKAFPTDDAAPECLAGLTFVFTGILPNVSRQEAEDYVKILGGRVTTAVSGKTSYLVVGNVLEDGRPYDEGKKYKTATKLNAIVVKGEEQLYGLAKLYSDKARATNPTQDASASSAQPANQREIKTAPPPLESNAEMAVKPRVTPSNPYAKPANPYARKAKPSAPSATAHPYASNPYARKKAPESVPPAATTATVGPNALWADKYAPQNTRDILGNQESVKKLSNWLSKWETVFNNPKAQGKSFSAPGGPRKAALLSGPPGIGKTTTAVLVAKEAGRDTLEFNASDVRSKKALGEGLGDVTGSQVLNFGPSGPNKKSPPLKRRCIIMDEVDGMGAGDRSGMAELIKMIKLSKVPIICICNDRQSQKMRSLVPYCLDLRYKRPVKTVIARRAVRIGEMEGMKVEQNAAEAIAESCGNDIRQVVNCLQMWSNKKGSKSSMTYKDLKERSSAINKDEILRVSLFDATKLLVEGRKGLAGADPKTDRDSLYKRSDAYFVDYSLMGLMVQQNYLKVMVGRYQEAKRTDDESKVLGFLENMSQASSSMSDFAIAEHAVRSGDQQWGLLPLCSMLSVKTGYHAGGENGSFLPGFPEFAGWMGKNSTRGKKVRILQELQHHVNYKVSGDSREFRLRYLPTMRKRLFSLMTKEEGAETADVIELMDEYGLDRDDVFENLDEFKMDSKAKSFSSLDSKQKAAFTREYNKGSHKSQALVAEQGVGATSKRKKKTSEADPIDPDAVNDDAALEGSDDEGDESDSEAIRALFSRKKRAKPAKGGKTAKKRKSTGSRKKS